MASRNKTGYEEERVTAAVDPDVAHRFLPKISSGGISRPFEPEDITRVMDFDGVPEPPADGALMFGEEQLREGTMQFPVYYFCLRGGYLFYFKPEDVDEDSGPYAMFHGPPVGVVPLEHVQITFPPGGRRVFREHAHTEARTGYELVILHVPDKDEAMQARPPFFLVAESMGLREKWADALRARSPMKKATTLRAGFATTTKAAKKNDKDDDAERMKAQSESAMTSQAMMNEGKSEQPKEAPSTKPKNRRGSIFAKGKSGDSIKQSNIDSLDDAELANTIVEFGTANFNETEWMEHFFQVYSDFDAPVKCRQMEHFQTEMKKNLKGAVLEQYEYFVQASGEMTTMGKEVTSLKQWIETQVETILDMKKIDFSGGLDEASGGDQNADASDVGDLPRLDGQDDEKNEVKPEDNIFEDFLELEKRRKNQNSEMQELEKTEDDAPPIDIPVWLEEVLDEAGAFVREASYSDAIDLILKGKSEIIELMDKHERPTAYRLTQQQVRDLFTLQRQLGALGKRIGDRLEETLRRKNEALRQASKRERTDPNATVTVVSPCALDDDAFYLQLMVKLGKTSNAADAYSARRSLLLLEALNDRPISGAGSVDLVIYAAQLSQSFFSCLANSVEGFLDLFSSSPLSAADKSMDGDSVSGSSLHSQSITGETMKAAPAGAVASVVLWCDSELAKFATAFGGARILQNLALSPPPRDKGPRVVGEDGVSKERKNAIDVAAQCIDQAFMYATENLDSVGLPLAPRLAEYIRQRLKGCEEEVSEILDDRWQHLTVDWKSNTIQTNGSH
jgi:hypothetical protein